MVSKLYIPDRGDVVWISFGPSIGREQTKRRPAVVMSPRSYNKRAGLAFFCPITSQIKGYPFEVSIHDGKISGAVLCDHIKNMDWRVRRTVFIRKLSPAHIATIQNKIIRLLTEE